MKLSFCQTSWIALAAVLGLLTACGGGRRTPARAPAPIPPPRPEATAPDAPPGPTVGAPPVTVAPPTEAPPSLSPGERLAHADPGSVGYERGVYRSAQGQELPYRLYRPPTDPGRSYPVLLYLHSHSASGSDNESHLEPNQIDGADFWTSPEIQSRYPSFVVAPQTSPEMAPTWVKRWRRDPTEDPARREPLELAIELLEELSSRYPIDRDRWYVAGYSMGAFGAWIAISRHPDLFAAAVPVSGGGDATHVGDTEAAVWAFHGTADRITPVRRTRQMVEAIQEGGGDIRYTELKANHNIWHEALQTPGLVDWLFAQRRGL